MFTAKLVSTKVENGWTVMQYAANFTVTTAGDGLWGCEAGRKVNVTNIYVITEGDDEDALKTVNVEHDSTWDIYTDGAFERAISEALGFTVAFTEQGMQEDEFASMEA
jgi:hypothetical protein